MGGEPEGWGLPCSHDSPLLTLAANNGLLLPFCGLPYCDEGPCSKCGRCQVLLSSQRVGGV